jgi:hypothetical protein
MTLYRWPDSGINTYLIGLGTLGLGCSLGRLPPPLGIKPLLITSPPRMEQFLSSLSIQRRLLFFLQDETR